MALDKKEIEELLLKTEIVYLATSDKEGSPHVKPIWFVYHKGKIWFETKETTKAFRNIKESNKIMLCFGGKETYLVWGKVKWFRESECPIPLRKLYWEKYNNEMEDEYIDKESLIFEVIIRKEKSWHYLAGET